MNKRQYKKYLNINKNDLIFKAFEICLAVFDFQIKTISLDCRDRNKNKSNYKM